MRWVALLLASLFLVALIPAQAAPPTVSSYTRFTTAQFESIATDILKIPQVASAMPDGSTLRFVVQGMQDPESDLSTYDSAWTWTGSVSGGRVTLTANPRADWHPVPRASFGPPVDLELSAYDTFWGALVNACDRANTAKLGIRDGFVGIDGSSAARAAANGIGTGRFDAQLAAERPTAGEAFPCQGYTPTLMNEKLNSEFWRQHYAAFESETILTGEMDGRRYIINKVGAIEAQLPSAWLSKAVHEHFSGEDQARATTEYDTYGTSHGSVPIPDECKLVGDGASRVTKIWAVATCLKDLRTKEASS